MKGKLAYLLLVAGIIVLLVAAAILTKKLFDSAPSDGTRVSAPPAEAAPPVARVLIDADQAAPPAAPPSPAPVAGIKAPAQPPAAPQAPAAVKAAQPASSAIGRLTFLVGTATAVGPSGKSRLLALDAEVFLGDHLDTARSSKLEVTFTDGSVLSEGENSSLVLDEYLFDAPNKNGNFVLRFTRGICRIVTGAIVTLKPDQFKVRTRMATMGIRGCDVGIRTTPTSDEFNVLEIPRGKTIRIDTTTNGSRMMDEATGKILPVDETKKAGVDIVEPMTTLTVTSGQGYEQKKVSLQEIRGLLLESSRLTPARFSLQQGSGSASIAIETPTNNPAPEK